MYLYFSLLSSKIKFWQHDKCSFFQKSPKLPLNPALNPAWNHFFQFFFRNAISGLLCTMYLYFSLLSSKIKIWQHYKCSNVRKSPQTPPFFSPKSGPAPFFKIFFSEMLLVGYYVLCIYISAFYHQK